MRIGTSLSYLLPDHLGSPAVTVNAADTNVITRTGYKPWGEERYGAALSTFGYTGQRDEPDLDNLYYGARWYDSALHRFIQADTIVPNPYNPLDWDRYAYVRGNPIRNIDPTGHAVADGTQGGCGLPSCIINPPTPTPTSTPTPTPTATPTPTMKPTAGLAWSANPTRTPTPPTLLLPGSTYTPTPTLQPTVIRNRDGISIQVDWRNLVDWSRVDKIDAGIDVFGIVGQFAPAIHLEIGGVIFVASEVVEGAGVVKDIYDLAKGDPSGVSLSAAEKVFEVVIDAGRVDPSRGLLFNVLSLGTNIGPAINADAIQIYR